MKINLSLDSFQLQVTQNPTQHWLKQFRALFHKVSYPDYFQFIFCSMVYPWSHGPRWIVQIQVIDPSTGNKAEETTKDIALSLRTLKICTQNFCFSIIESNTFVCMMSSSYNVATRQWLWPSDHVKISVSLFIAEKELQICQIINSIP